MWIERPLIINDHSKITEVYEKSINYLNNNDSLYEKIAKHLWAYHEIGTLIHQTVENVLSGHYFPYSEAYIHLEKSYQLCLEGFYTYAYFALRRMEVAHTFAREVQHYLYMKDKNISHSILLVLEH